MINCDYYINHDIIIYHISSDETIKQFKIHLMTKRGYVGFVDDECINDELKKHLELQIKLNTYNTILYYDGKWINKKYNYLLDEYLDEIKIIKCYENVYAYKSN